ncbi:hypothetical protein TAO_1242 [Candidatus Nitrosoglobus terrae]|uniref:Uncharacterized protein n=1 Tax=Candidatus Nitrosoglobus terrae TaxID=1630141 RepID=A0A1Q2SNB8_9GAMM|nr:hypothetical protein [Candidatus Nitrosoglobus terrae]BAW80612.1 hypothetical protein TAO_1242 [Candidatus Nitrosoglobus terrae]
MKNFTTIIWDLILAIIGATIVIGLIFLFVKFYLTPVGYSWKNFFFPTSIICLRC